MKLLAGYTILIAVMVVEWYCHCLVFLARIARRGRMKFIMWRINRLCRQIAQRQRSLARLLNRHERLESK